MESILKNKSGQASFIGWFFVLVIILAVAVVLLVTNYAWGEIKDPLMDGLNDTVSGDDEVQISNTLDQTTGGIGFFDNLLPFLIIGLFGFIAITAGAFMKSPIFIFVGVIILGVIFLLAVVYSNLYKNMVDTTELNSTSDNLPIQEALMRYLPLILIAAILLVIIISTIGSKGGASL